MLGLNANHHPQAIFQKVLSETILRNDIEVVLIGGTSPDYRDIEKIIEEVRCIKDNLTIIIGGYLVTTEPVLVMENIGADYGIIGRGEDSTTEILNALSSDNPLSARNVEGIVYVDNNGKAVITNSRVTQKFDFSRIPDLEILFERDIRNSKQIQVLGSIGCPYKCTFCARPADNTPRYQQRSLDSLFYEIDYWVSKYIITDIFIIDETFSINESRLLEFCERIQAYNVGYNIQFRVDLLSSKIAKVLKRSGCHTIRVGLESMNVDVLTSMNKKITPAQIEKVVDIANENNLSLVGNFIFGDPSETLDTAFETINWWKSNFFKHDIYLDMIQALPGSLLYERAVRKKIIADKLSFLRRACPIVNLTGLSTNEFDNISNTINCLRQMRSQALRVEVEQLNISGTVDLTVQCQHCLHSFSIVDKDLTIESRWSYETCPSCRRQILISPSDLISPFDLKGVLDLVCEDYFSKVFKSGDRVIIWGSYEEAQIMLLSSQSLRAANPMIIDFRFRGKFTKFLGTYSAFGPEHLSLDETDTIIITSRQSRKHVYEIIEHSTSIKVIDLFKNDGRGARVPPND